MIKDLHIRSATIGDAATLAELAATTFHEAFDGTTSQENVDDYVNSELTAQKMKKELADPRAMFFIVDYMKRAVAYMKLFAGEVPESVTDQCAIELSRLYVRKNFLAQKIGSLLMQKAIEEARKKGYRMIFLGVWENNERAKIFYHKWGFKKVGQHVFQMGDDPQIDWWMERKI